MASGPFVRTLFKAFWLSVLLVLGPPLSLWVPAYSLCSLSPLPLSLFPQPPSSHGRVQSRTFQRLRAMSSLTSTIAQSYLGAVIFFKFKILSRGQGWGETHRVSLLGFSERRSQCCDCMTVPDRGLQVRGGGGEICYKRQPRSLWCSLPKAFLTPAAVDGLFQAFPCSRLCTGVLH